ncbi:MAG: (Fe-S)-binding protein, partial [Zoogloea sp.]|nr:(Fe-S)-binding protein [Zoogloea sp.]
GGAPEVGNDAARANGCGAGEGVTGDCGCLMTIRGHAEKTGVDLPGEHLASFLWRRTGGRE